MDVFDADSAKAPHFVLSQLGTDKTSAMARWGDPYSVLLCPSVGNLVKVI